MVDQGRTTSFAILIATVLALGLGVLLAIPTYWPRPYPPLSDPDIKVNPNTAPVGLLMQLPGIGPARAKAIDSYRRQVSKARPGPVFRDVNDLKVVRGIGPQTIRQMARYLRFEDP